MANASGGTCKCGEVKWLGAVPGGLRITVGTASGARGHSIEKCDPGPADGWSPGYEGKMVDGVPTFVPRKP